MPIVHRGLHHVLRLAVQVATRKSFGQLWISTQLALAAVTDELLLRLLVELIHAHVVADLAPSIVLGRFVFHLEEGAGHVVLNDHGLVQVGAAVGLLLCKCDVLLLAQLGVLDNKVVKSDVLEVGPMGVCNQSLALLACETALNILVVQETVEEQFH